MLFRNQMALLFSLGCGLRCVGWCSMVFGFACFAFALGLRIWFWLLVFCGWLALVLVLFFLGVLCYCHRFSVFLAFTCFLCFAVCVFAAFYAVVVLYDGSIVLLSVGGVVPYVSGFAWFWVFSAF